MIETHSVNGCEVDVYREDLRVGAAAGPFLPHGKTSSLIALFDALLADRVNNVSCFASRGSDWVYNAAICAKTCEIKLTIYAQKPSKRFPVPAFIEQARDEHGARIEFVRVNHTLIMSAVAKKHAQEYGDFFIPFGLELPVVGNELTERLRGIARRSPTLVLCAGSGVTLACILCAALQDQLHFKNVIAVSSGRSAKAIKVTLARHLDSAALMSATDKLTIITGEERYGEAAAAAETLESPWPTHLFYERKAFLWLHRNIAELRKSDEKIGFLNM